MTGNSFPCITLSDSDDDDVILVTRDVNNIEKVEDDSKHEPEPSTSKHYTKTKLTNEVYIIKVAPSTSKSTTNCKPNVIDLTIDDESENNKEISDSRSTISSGLPYCNLRNDQLILNQSNIYSIKVDTGGNNNLLFNTANSICYSKVNNNYNFFKHKSKNSLSNSKEKIIKTRKEHIVLLSPKKTLLPKFRGVNNVAVKKPVRPEKDDNSSDDDKPYTRKFQTRKLSVLQQMGFNVTDENSICFRNFKEFDDSKTKLDTDNCLDYLGLLKKNTEIEEKTPKRKLFKYDVPPPTRQRDMSSSRLMELRNSRKEFNVTNVQHLEGRAGFSFTDFFRLLYRITGGVVPYQDESHLSKHTEYMNKLESINRKLKFTENDLLTTSKNIVEKHIAHLQRQRQRDEKIRARELRRKMDREDKDYEPTKSVDTERILKDDGIAKSKSKRRRIFRKGFIRRWSCPIKIYPLPNKVKDNNTRSELKSNFHDEDELSSDDLEEVLELCDTDSDNDDVNKSNDNNATSDSKVNIINIDSDSNCANNDVKLNNETIIKIENKLDNNLELNTSKNYSDNSDCKISPCKNEQKVTFKGIKNKLNDAMKIIQISDTKLTEQNEKFEKETLETGDTSCNGNNYSKEAVVIVNLNSSNDISSESDDNRIKRKVKKTIKQRDRLKRTPEKNISLGNTKESKRKYKSSDDETTSEDEVTMQKFKTTVKNNFHQNISNAYVRSLRNRQNLKRPKRIEEKMISLNKKDNRMESR